VGGELSFAPPKFVPGAAPPKRGTPYSASGMGEHMFAKKELHQANIRLCRSWAYTPLTPLSLLYHIGAAFVKSFLENFYIKFLCQDIDTQFFTENFSNNS